MSKGKEQIQVLVKCNCGLSFLCPHHGDILPWQMVLNAFKPQRYQKLFNKRTDDSHKQKSSNKTTILHFCMFGPVGYDQEFSGCYQQRDSDIEESRFSRGAGKQLT